MAGTFTPGTQIIPQNDQRRKRRHIDPRTPGIHSCNSPGVTPRPSDARARTSTSIGTGARQQIHLPPVHVAPIHRKFLHPIPRSIHQHQQLDVEREPKRPGPRQHRLHDLPPKHFEPALRVVDLQPRNQRHQRRKKPTRHVPRPLSLHRPPPNPPPRPDQPIDLRRPLARNTPTPARSPPRSPPRPHPRKPARRTLARTPHATRDTPPPPSPRSAPPAPDPKSPPPRHLPPRQRRILPTSKNRHPRTHHPKPKSKIPPAEFPQIR